MPTERTRVVREAERGVYDRETVYQILDEGFLCHVGFVMDGQPFVIPTSYGRKNSHLYIHGSAASRITSSTSRAPVISRSKTSCAAPAFSKASALRN